MALGKFADLSEEEFERVHLRYRPSAARVANVASELTYEKVASYLGEVQMDVASTGASSSQMEARIEQESGKSFAWTSPPNGYNAVVTPCTTSRISARRAGRLSPPIPSRAGGR